jgi:hypothetical protein
MKTLKKILIVVAVLIVIPLVTALFVKKTYTVEREILIEKPKQVVFDYIKLLKNQNNYSRWATMDPNMKQEFIGIDGNVGFVSSWDSNQKDVGKGEQTIVKITAGERIDFDLHFIKPFETRSKAYMTTDAVSENQTKVKWGFTGKMNYPMNISLLFMDMDKMLGKDLSTGLTSLKKMLEK